MEIRGRSRGEPVPFQHRGIIPALWPHGISRVDPKRVAMNGVLLLVMLASMHCGGSKTSLFLDCHHCMEATVAAGSFIELVERSKFTGSVPPWVFQL